MKNRIRQAWRFIATHKLNTLIVLLAVSYAPSQYDNVWWWSTVAWIGAAFATERTSNIWRSNARRWEAVADGWEGNYNAARCHRDGWRDMYYMSKGEQPPPL